MANQPSVWDIEESAYQPQTYKGKPAAQSKPSDSGMMPPPVDMPLVAQGREPGPTGVEFGLDSTDTEAEPKRRSRSGTRSKKDKARADRSVKPKKKYPQPKMSEEERARAIGPNFDTTTKPGSGN